MIDVLQTYLDSVRHVPFQWGKHDCGLFAAKWLDAKHGSTFMSDALLAMEIDSAAEYRRWQREGNSLENTATSLLGPPSSNAPDRGDVVLVQTIKGATLGIAVPPVALCVSDAGVIPMPMATVARVWRQT